MLPIPNLEPNFARHPYFSPDFVHRKRAYTEIFLVQNHEVLLGEKKRGFKQGKFFGYGGKVERGDPSIVAAALREFSEETDGAVPLDLRQVGVVWVEFRGQEPSVNSPDQDAAARRTRSDYLPGKCLEIHVFRSTGVLPDQHSVMETEEMRPVWFETTKIPWDLCLPDVRNWYPLAIDGGFSCGVREKWAIFRAEYVVDADDHDSVLYEKVELLDEHGRVLRVPHEFVKEGWRGDGAGGVARRAGGSSPPRAAGREETENTRFPSRGEKSEKKLADRLLEDVDHHIPEEQQSASSDPLQEILETPCRSLAGFPAFLPKLNALTGPQFDVHFSPFQVKWYNDIRRKTANSQQLLDVSNERALALVGISGPDFFEKSVLPTYERNKTAGTLPDSLDFVDTATAAVIGHVKRFFAHLEEGEKKMAGSMVRLGFANIKYANTDLPPYIHVQSIGHVAGVDQHIDPMDPDCQLDEEILEDIAAGRDPKIWGENNRTVHGLNLHPEFGGWYAYRILVVLPNYLYPAELVTDEPMVQNFIPEEEKRYLLEEFNLHPDEDHWRDVCAAEVPATRGGGGGEGKIAVPQRRYSGMAYLYFHERDSKKRARCLELAAERRGWRAAVGGRASEEGEGGDSSSKEV